jgi:hypothetical protein
LEMMRKLLVPSLAAGVVLCLGLGSSGSQAATADTVQLRVEAPSIDGAVQFSDASGWSWRCSSGVCTVTTARGNTLTVTAVNGGASTFQGWGGACAQNGAQPACTLQLNDSLVSVTARFARQRLWLPAFGGGSITVSSPTPGYSCGYACADYATGQQLVLRASPWAGYRATAWGGNCTGVRADHGCVLTLSRSTVVSATFEPIPPPGDCPPNQSCDPVTVSTNFSVAVTGSGTVSAPRQGSNPTLTCSSSGTTGRTCSLDRAVEKTVYVTASGVNFLRWGGRCAGVRSTTCSFVNRRYSRDPALITAVFG